MEVAEVYIEVAGLTIRLGQDWLSALRSIDRVFPGSKAELIRCSGGLPRIVPWGSTDGARAAASIRDEL